MRTPREANAPATVTAYPDGPLVVRGPALIIDESGEPVERRRRTIAICRCDRSTIAPYCDGSHKVGKRPTLRAVEIVGPSNPESEEDAP